MNIYKATQEDDTIIGSMAEISRSLNITRQAVSKAIKSHHKVKGYTIVFSHGINRRARSQTKYQQCISLLTRAKLIIQDHNTELANAGQYSNIGIVDDIDKFIKDNT